MERQTIVDGDKGKMQNYLFLFLLFLLLLIYLFYYFLFLDFVSVADQIKRQAYHNANIKGII